MNRLTVLDERGRVLASITDESDRAVARHREIHPNGCGFAFCVVCTAPAPSAGCLTCSGSGIVYFCPSAPDQCAGCEMAPCPDCVSRVPKEAIS